MQACKFSWSKLNMSNKLSRGSNYIESDKALLIDCVEKLKHIIENKKTDSTSINVKDKAWEQIANDYNSATTTSARSQQSLRSCYDNLKKTTRKRAANERVEIFKTGKYLFIYFYLTTNPINTLLHNWRG